MSKEQFSRECTTPSGVAIRANWAKDAYHLRRPYLAAARRWSSPIPEHGPLFRAARPKMRRNFLGLRGFGRQAAANTSPPAKRPLRGQPADDGGDASRRAFTLEERLDGLGRCQSKRGPLFCTVSRRMTPRAVHSRAVAQSYSSGWRRLERVDTEHKMHIPTDDATENHAKKP